MAIKIQYLYTEAASRFQAIPVASSDRSIDDLFDSLKNKWISETGYLSDPEKIYNNTSYRQIVDLGDIFLPLILNDLEINYHNWFYALELITGANPIRDEHRGDIEAMTCDWMQWRDSQAININRHKTMYAAPTSTIISEVSR
jgi:hypothetical protein